MDRDTLLKSLAGTLDPNPLVRKQSETQLRQFESQQGFTGYLLDLINEPQVQLGIQTSAAIFFKNRVNHYWIFIDDGHKQSELYVKDFEKPSIKQKLIETIIKNQKVLQIRQQLTTALSKILNVDKWEELLSIIKTLISDQSNVDNVYGGLLCLYEYSKCNRLFTFESLSTSNPIFEDITQELFPKLELLTSSLINNQEENLLNDEMLYLIVKIFKFITYSILPSYFMENDEKLGTWCHYHILIINKPLPKLVMEEESAELRCMNPRIKTIKWCFGNLHRLLSRHGGGHATSNKDSKFSNIFISKFVPEILNIYWVIIENWSSKKIWLSDPSLYHMISFLEQLIDTPAWSLIEEKLEAIVSHVLLPTLCANEETIELYEDDPEEYIRRFFDTIRESNTSDIASINFVFRLSSKKFASTINIFLNVINDIMTRRSTSRDSLKSAMEVEGAFRILSSLSYKLDKKNISPVHGQIDKILYNFVYPELQEQTIVSAPFLTARACDTIAMFIYKYKDEQILQDIFQSIVKCFQLDAQLPIQITAVDALRTLVDDENIANQIADQAPQLMGTLLDMSKKFESDLLTNVMDSFVDKFAKNLEPYANELAQRLSDQFIKIASELLDQHENINIEKEYQASGILTTIVTLILAMNSSPQVATSLEPIFESMIKFILENAMVSFLPEAIEILESVVFSTEQLSPIMWGLYESCIESFETYALEYFDTFQPFFECVINHGFNKESETIDSPHVQSLISVCFNILKSDSADPVFANVAFELLEMTALSMRGRFIPFLPRFLSEIFEVFQLLESQDSFDGHMLHHLAVLKNLFAALYIEPTFTLGFLSEKNFIAQFFQLWFKHSDSFQSVYGCKLQILAGLSILCDATNLQIFSQQQDILTESADLLISNLEVLPHAIKARQEILAKESSARQFNEDDENDDENEFNYDVDYEADEAELEALKQTPIDGVHVFEVFTQKILTLKQDNNKYQAIFGNLDDAQVEIVSKVVEISQQHLQQQQQQQQQQQH